VILIHTQLIDLLCSSFPATNGGLILLRPVSSVYHWIPP